MCAPAFAIVRSSVRTADLESLGISPEKARQLSNRLNTALRRHLGRSRGPADQVRRWLALRKAVAAEPTKGMFPVHLFLYRFAYKGRRPEDGPPPAWVPTPRQIRESHLGQLMRERGVRSYPDLHRWSVEDRDEFWSSTIERLGIVFQEKPRAIRDPRSDPIRPDWLPGARLNIAESCFRGDSGKNAILFASEAAPELRRVTLGDLHRLASRVAGGLEAIGTKRGDRVALYLPMTPESVAAFLGVILAGRVVVGISEASAPADFANRIRISGATTVFTVESYRRDGRDQRIYDKVIQADGPRAIILPSESKEPPRSRRPQDLPWDHFLSPRGNFEAVTCAPSDPSTILFSSGTTKDPKAVPWTHTTPIRSVADAYLHLDVHEDDVLAWPTSFGWMMGPWLTYASLVNRATMALYVGSTARREFGDFVARAGVTMLGVVPKLVRAWKAGGTMEDLEWSRIRRFSSTAEPSTPEEMLYLMFLSGYKPVIEYCGGTEIGGAYISGTVVQPCAPSTFTTPTLGLDFVILDERHPAARGEVFLIPPSIGLSNDLLNYDHEEEYYRGLPAGPHDELLRRHGDQIEALAGGYYRHHGRVDDMINIHGVKTSSEEIRSVLANDLVYDAKPIAVDFDGSGQARLIVYAVPRDRGLVGSEELRSRLRTEYQAAIKERLNPLLAHVEDVVLVAELPQAGPGKTRTMKELGKDYVARFRSPA